MLLMLSILIYIIQTITGKLIEVNDKNDLKKELKSHANILILFYDNDRSSTVKLLEDLSVKANKIAKIISVDCKENKKLCRHYKVEQNTVVIQHFHKGKFNKVYDRKLQIESLMRFLEDPKGDIPWEEEDNAKDIFHANSAQDLQKLVKGYKTNVPPLMLMFYAPWCGYCKKMKPEFAAAASSLKSRAVFIGINGDLVDTDELKQAFNVTGYPSVFLVQDGNKIYKYNSDNSKDALIKFVENPIEAEPPKETPWSEEVTEIDFLTDFTFDDFVSTHESVIVMFYAPWCGHCKSLKPELVKAAKKMKTDTVPGRLAAVDATEQKNLSSSFNITGFPTLKYFKSGEFQFDIYERTADGLVKFMLDPKKPKEPEKQVPWNQEQSAVHHPSAQEFKSTIKRYKNSLVMFYAPWCGHCKKAKPGFTAAANEMSDNSKVAFIAVDCTEAQYTDVCKHEGVEGFPTIRYYNYGKVTSYSEYSLEREQDDFVAFMKDPINPKLDARRHWKHITGHEAIAVLDTESFVQNVASQPSGALVMFYAPWCSHCNAMKPAFVAAALALKSSLPTCILATVDATSESNLAAQYNVKGFPTLIYFSPSGDWSKFNGERNQKDIVDFMLKKDNEIKKAAEEKKAEEEEKEDRRLKEEFEEKERKRQEIERQQIEETERQEKERKEKAEALERERQEIDRKQKEEVEYKAREQQERERKQKEAEEKERKEKERLHKEESEAKEREQQERERKQSADNEAKEKEQQERERKQREESVAKEREQQERKQNEAKEREMKQREETEAKEREQQEIERNQKEERNEADLSAGHLMKIDSSATFQDKLKLPNLYLVYFHKGNKKNHIRERVLKVLEKAARKDLISLDVDCAVLVDVCDQMGLATWPSISTFINGRQKRALADSWTEEDLEQLINSSVRDEL